MFSIRAKQRPIPSISLRPPPSKLQFYIGFRQFRPDYLSVFHDEDTVPPQELRIGCKFPSQAAAKSALCSILSVSQITFAVWMPKKIYRTSGRVSRPDLICFFLFFSVFARRHNASEFTSRWGCEDGYESNMRLKTCREAIYH
mgnify:CR=1 FL=1